jgi:hypothetical protein
MKRIVSALAAILVFLPAWAEAAPRARHAAAARACRAGHVRLASGLCCPRSGVTRRGGCVAGAIRPDIVPPPAFAPRDRTAPSPASPEAARPVTPQFALPAPVAPLPAPAPALPPHVPGTPPPALAAPRL